MEVVIKEIVQKLHDLPEVKLWEVLDFVEFLTWNKHRSTSPTVADNLPIQENDEFEAIANQLADEFTMYLGENVPVLSDYAVSRAGIYEEHP